MKKFIVILVSTLALLFGGLLAWDEYLMSNNEYESSSVSDSIDSYVDDPTTKRSFEEYADYDCSDFSSQDEAQEFFEANDPEYDYHNLDSDKDGYACELLTY